MPAAQDRPPILARIARHLAEDVGIRSPGGDDRAPSSVRALVRRAARGTVR